MKSRSGKHVRLSSAVENMEISSGRGRGPNRTICGLGRRMNTRNTDRVRVAPTNDIPRSREEGSTWNQPQSALTATAMYGDTATPTSAAPRHVTVDAPLSEVSVEPLENYLRAVRTEREILLGTVKECTAKVHNMDFDSKWIAVTVTTIFKHVMEPKKHNEELRTENLSTKNENDEFVTTMINRIPAPRGRDKEE